MAPPWKTATRERTDRSRTGTTPRFVPSSCALPARLRALTVLRAMSTLPVGKLLRSTGRPGCTSAQETEACPARPAGQAWHQFPQVALAEPSASGSSQQRPAQLPPFLYSRPLRPVGQVGVQVHHRGRSERDLRLPGALADHAQHPVAGVLAQVSDVGSAGLIDTQGVMQQQPHHRRGEQRLRTSIGVGGGDHSTGLVAAHVDSGRIVQVLDWSGHALGGHQADQVVGRALPVKNDDSADRRRRTLDAAAPRRAGWRP